MVGRRSLRDDRVLGFTRGLSLFIVPFLLVAFVILYLFPEETARLWAWTIPSTMTSMVLASAYLGGAYFFLRVQLSPAVRVVVGLVGAGALVQGLVMFLWPDSVIDAWPWPLTPLTCRVLAAGFCLAAAGVGVWFDPRWEAIRLMTQVAAVMVTLILLAAVRARDELDASSTLAWPLLIGMSVLLVGSAVLWLRYEWRPRQVEQLPTPTA